jgi:hypothetical protein
VKAPSPLRMARRTPPAWMLGETHAYALIVELGLGHVYATFGGHSWCVVVMCELAIGLRTHRPFCSDPSFEGVRFVAGLMDR